MAEWKKRGTVTPLDSLFTSEEAEKAARLVDEAIANRQEELHRLHDFIADNSALIHDVQKLPDELSHDIMVPFGGAAFFPGRLIHTNEFMVLLGEGYYAERSAKQTVEILQRRGKSLDAHLESLKRVIKDLDAEAKFFKSTAAEVAEGLVEIREEYVEEIQKEPEKGLSSRIFVSPLKVHNSVVLDEENEDAEIMARFDEVDEEEEEAVCDLGQDENVETTSSSDVDEDEDEDEYVNDNAKEVFVTDDKAQVLVSQAKGPGTFVSTSLQQNLKDFLQYSSNQSSVSGSKIQISSEGSLESIVEQPYMPQNFPPPLESIVHHQKPPRSSIQNSSESIPSQISKTGSAESKAFTGTVIEHGHGLTIDSSSVQPSRPVSRFKMQRSNR